MTKTISVVIDKGGVGKTTTIINALFYSARRLGKKCLLIDLDQSPSSTARFIDKIDQKYFDEDHEIKRNYTVAKFFDTTDGNPEIIEVEPNIHLIAGYKQLSDLKEKANAGLQRLYLLNWYYRNIDFIESNYDYIFIDNHNDLEIFTDNAIAVSDVVIAVADVDLDSMGKLAQVDSHVEYLKTIIKDPMTQRSYVDAQVVKIGNIVEYNTTDSHAFVEAFESMKKQDSTYLGYLYKRTALKQTKTKNRPLVEVEDNQSSFTENEKQFYAQTWALFDKILDI